MRTTLALLLVLVGAGVLALGAVEATDAFREGWEVGVSPAGLTAESGTPTVNYSSLSADSQAVFDSARERMGGDEYVLTPADFDPPMVVTYRGSDYFVEFVRFQYCDPNYASELLLGGLLLAAVGGCVYRGRE